MHAAETMHCKPCYKYIEATSKYIILHICSNDVSINGCHVVANGAAQCETFHTNNNRVAIAL